MKLSRRDFSGEADLLAMMALARACPADNGHIADWPYRLSSWALDDPGNVGLWVDEGGQLLAWAVLQAPFWTIDYICHHRAGQGLRREVLAWADQRACQMLGTPAGHPCWFVMTFASQPDHIRDVEAAGFVCQAHVAQDPWSRVLLHRPAQIPVVGCAVPGGFAIRPLAGEDEIEAYVTLHRAVFESKNMTVAWRRRAVRRPEYRPELDLVAVAPDGSLAAFCLAWFAQAAWLVQPGWADLPGWRDRSPQGVVGQIEPLGVGADFRGVGLGRAILADALRRLYRNGAEAVYVETEQDRSAALELYQALGFRPIQDTLVYRRDYSPTADP